MEDLLVLENTKGKEYERLLLRRDALKKEANVFLAEYIHVFGERMVRNYEKKIECIEKKKAIAFCQTMQNKGLQIKATDLSGYLFTCMEQYRKQLEEMKADRDACKVLKSTPLYLVQKVKEFYRKIVKVIHPDKQPELFEQENIREYWNEVQDAYRRNDPDRMEELLVLLNGLGVESQSYTSGEIEQKIQKIRVEIENIVSTDPYCYRFILDNPEEVKQRSDELDAEYAEYKAYALELNAILDGYHIEEVQPWEMN